MLSGNDVEHALIGLAAMEIGVPYCPISPPYALASQDFAKLQASPSTFGRTAADLPLPARRQLAPLGARGPRPGLSRRAQRRPRLAHADLRRDARRGRAHRRGVCSTSISAPSGRSSSSSGNDIEHALIGLAAMEIGVPYCPISPPYSLASQRLRQAALRLRPADAGPGLRDRRRRLRARARRRRRRRRSPRVAARDADAADGRRRSPTSSPRRPAPQLERAHARVGPETIAKILFTSGSTGIPKASSTPSGCSAAINQ